MLQNVLLALEVRVVEADERPTLNTDRVDPVHKASVLKVVTVAAEFQLPAGETFALVEHNLFSPFNKESNILAKLLLF